MAHYAFIDENNKVTEVIFGKDEDELLDGLTTEEWYSNFRNQRCIRTSYNGTIRKNFAGIDYIYDEERDAFIPPKYFNRWVLNEDTCRWESPVPYPDNDKQYVWNDNQGVWEELILD